MFKNIIIGNGSSIGSPKCDFGLIVENLTFYQNVTLVLTRGEIIDLIKNIGIDNFSTLILDTHVKFVFQKDIRMTVNRSGESVHDFGSTMLSAHKDGKKISTNEEILLETLLFATNEEKSSEKIAGKLYNKIEFYHTVDDSDFNLTSIIIDAICQKKILNTAIPKVINILAPGYGFSKKNFIEIQKISGKGINVQTNIDFNLINKLYAKKYPKQPINITLPYILALFSSTMNNLSLAAKYEGSVFVNPVDYNFSSHLLHSFAAKYHKVDNNTEIMQKVATEKARTVREVVNSNEKSFSDAIKLINSGEKYRKWAHKVDEDKKLIHEYVKSISKEDMVSSFPIKTVRFFYTAVSGLINPFLGLGTSAVDTFLCDNLAKGWKPNMFINGPLKKFLK